MPTKVSRRRILVLEQLIRLQILLMELLAMLAVIVGIAFAIWLIEYFIHGIVFLDWLERRWYVVGIILLTVGFGFIREGKECEVAWSDLENRFPLFGDPPPRIEELEYATGRVRIGGKSIVPAGGSVSQYGLTLWRNGKPKILIPWERIERISLRGKAAPYLQADIQLFKRHDHLPPLVISVPWAPEMTETTPKALFDI